MRPTTMLTTIVCVALQKSLDKDPFANATLEHGTFMIKSCLC